MEEWEEFRNIVMDCANDVCVMRCVSGQRRNGSEWWNEQVSGAVAEREAFEEWLEGSDTVTYDRYRVQRVVGKRGVKLQKNGGLVMGRAIGE